MISLTPAQLQFYNASQLEVLFGGSTGGGKTTSLIATALQHVHIPGYRIIIFRQNYRSLTMSGGLVDRVEQTLKDRRILFRYNARILRFSLTGGPDPHNPASLELGYLPKPESHLNYGGMESQFIGIDEVTDFETELEYLFLLTRLRRRSDLTNYQPLQMRVTGTPCGPGRKWVRKRFIDEYSIGTYIPCNSMTENPFLAGRQYEQYLEALSPVDRARMTGDWNIEGD